MPFIFAVSGLKKSGKTTTALFLASRLKAAGCVLCYVKRSHEIISTPLDTPGTDTGRAVALGLKTLLWTPRSLRYIAEGGRETEILNQNLTLDDIYPYLVPSDVVIIEGGKSLDVPKIWLEKRRGDILE
jgi:molybdopterin-guanine dinucleotide biosynthesis protein B